MKAIYSTHSYNTIHAFKVIVFSDYLAKFHRKQLEENIPFFLQGVGSSIWIKKLS